MEKKILEKPVVISLGGSMLFDEKGNFDLNYITEFSALLLKLRKEGMRFVVAVGGGKIAKDYCNAVRELRGSEFLADRIAIMATRMNALLLISVLGDQAYQKVITDLDEAPNVLAMGLIPVGAGIIEGVTTDTASTLLAELVNAGALVNVSNIDAIYSDDPKKNLKAEKFREMTHRQLAELAAAQDKRVARTNFPFDLMACKLAMRSNIPIHFVYGKNLNEVEKALTGKEHAGTVVKD
ncbi:UMP kinase [Candidatus Micrarchaeota archaeon]|nr:UMP kinase [Candidatus Micrarchaeota archaeon]